MICVVRDLWSADPAQQTCSRFFRTAGSYPWLSPHNMICRPCRSYRPRNCLLCRAYIISRDLICSRCGVFVRECSYKWCCALVNMCSYKLRPRLLRSNKYENKKVLMQVLANMALMVVLKQMIVLIDCASASCSPDLTARTIDGINDCCYHTKRHYSSSSYNFSYKRWERLRSCECSYLQAFMQALLHSRETLRWMTPFTPR